MKLLIFYLVIFLSVSFHAFAGKIPAEVKRSFEQKFPGAIHARWEKENSNEFEVSFVWNDTRHSANFDDKGVLLETEMEIGFRQLPEKVQSAFTAANPGVKVKEVSKISAATGMIKYEIEFKKELKCEERFFTEEGVETD